MFNPMNISSLNPTITGTDGWTNKGTIGVKFTRIPNVTYQYTIDGGNGWSTLSGSSFSVTSEGDYTNKLKVKATYKNETRELSTTVSYKYDKTPPTASREDLNSDDVYIYFKDTGGSGMAKVILNSLSGTQGDFRLGGSIYKVDGFNGPKTWMTNSDWGSKNNMNCYLNNRLWDNC